MPFLNHEEIHRFLRGHVPEIADGSVAVRGLARKPGDRILIVVDSADPRTSPVGTVMGRKGARIKEMVKQVNGEKSTWSDCLTRSRT